MGPPRRRAVALLFAITVSLRPLCADPGIVAADSVRLRKGPSVDDAIIRVLPVGALADILGAGMARERIDASREFSYLWYNVRLLDGTEGWVYGQFFYVLEQIGSGVVELGGRQYRLAVFREDGFVNDMPSDDRYALPCLIREDDSAAVTFSVDAGMYAQLPGYTAPGGRDIALPETTYLLVSNTGMSENAVSVAVERRGDREAVRLAVRFSLQAGGGSYALILAPPTADGRPFRVVAVEDAELRSGP